MKRQNTSFWIVWLALCFALAPVATAQGFPSDNPTSITPSTAVPVVAIEALADALRGQGLGATTGHWGEANRLAPLPAQGVTVVVPVLLPASDGSLTWRYWLLAGVDEMSGELIFWEQVGGSDLRMSASDFDSVWRPLQRTYLLSYAPAREAEIFVQAGLSGDGQTRRLQAMQAAEAEARVCGDVYSWLGLAVAQKDLRLDGLAAESLKQAHALGLPAAARRFYFERILWSDVQADVLSLNRDAEQELAVRLLERLLGKETVHPTPTFTPTQTPTPTATFTETPTATPIPTETPTFTATPSPIPTDTPLVETPTPTVTPAVVEAPQGEALEMSEAPAEPTATPAELSGSTLPAEIAGWPADVLAQINALRAEHGRQPYVWSPALAAAAQAHAEDCARRGFGSHVGSDGAKLRARLQRGGVALARSSENWVNSRLPEKAVSWWYNEPAGQDPHRRNLLAAHFTEVGIGIGVGANGRYYFVADFAGP